MARTMDTGQALETANSILRAMLDRAEADNREFTWPGLYTEVREFGPLAETILIYLRRAGFLETVRRGGMNHPAVYRLVHERAFNENDLKVARQQHNLLSAERRRKRSLKPKRSTNAKGEPKVESPPSPPNPNPQVQAEWQPPGPAPAASLWSPEDREAKLSHLLELFENLLSPEPAPHVAKAPAPPMLPTAEHVLGLGDQLGSALANLVIAVYAMDERLRATEGRLAEAWAILEAEQE